MPSTASASAHPAPSALTSLLSQHQAKTESVALPLEILHNLRHQHHWRDLTLHLITTSTTSTISSISSNSSSNTPTELLTLDHNHNHNHNSSLHSSSHSPSSSPSSPSSSSPSSHPTNSIPQFLISGLPPHHTYLHPDLQTHLIRRKLPSADIAKSLRIQREWVLPMSLGEKWTLKKFCAVFDALPAREALEVAVANDDDGGGAAGAAGAACAAGAAGIDLDWKDAKRVLMGMLSTNGMGGDGTIVYYIMQEGEVKPRQNG